MKKGDNYIIPSDSASEISPKQEAERGENDPGVVGDIP